MRFIPLLFLGKYKYLTGLMLLLVILLTCAAFSSADYKDFDVARREATFRRIGHELLLQSGDSTSRILPLKKISETEYLISFEKEFAFVPDSLVKITRSLLINELTANDYVVNVLNCRQSGVVYSYAISNNKKNDIVGCTGRKQPKACHTFNIKFKPTAATINIPTNRYLLGSLPFLAIIGFVFFKSAKRNKSLPESHCNNVFTLGSVLFDAQNRKLTMGEIKTDLTVTETRVLLMFALAPNEIIERTRLQKEIWEDEGVIVGRSLDMFISKLRKKLSLDPDVNIVVVRGKGYKMEVVQ